MGNYDILRKQMVELELEYRQLMLSKASTEDQMRQQVESKSSNNIQLQ